MVTERRNASAGERKGGHRTCGARLFALLLAMAAGTVAADELEQVLQLARAGAVQLALGQVDAVQPTPSADRAAWVRWERARIDLLRRQGAWRRIEERLAQLPDGLDAEFAEWAAETRAEALLELDEPAVARALLADLIWNGEPGERLPYRRRLVVRSYFDEGRVDDAYAAMLRYRQDYGSAEDDRLLRARVLLGAARYRDAEALLRQLPASGEAAALALLARLRSGAEPRGIAQAARERLKVEGLAEAERQLLRGVWAQAARAGGDFAGEVDALERLLAQVRDHPLPRGLFRLGADDLWRAYQAYAHKVGNREQLLLGDDPAWFALAAGDARRQPLRARSIHALIGLTGATAELRERGHRLLVRQLATLQGGDRVLYALYLDSPRFAGAPQIPVAARQALADVAIADGDLELASRLLQGLNAPPDVADRFMWELRRAKVFILAGDGAAGAGVLSDLLDVAPALSRDQIDRLVQLLFDLQRVGRDDEAYGLFERLYGLTGERQLQRELLFWMADSRSAQERHREAGLLYLRSAILEQAEAMDPWAQTARYQAAQALAKAGLPRDAGALLRQLLAVTDDPQRRAVLLRELEQLRLAEAAPS